MLMSDCCHFVKGLDPVADAFAGTVYSDVIDIKNHRQVTFVVYKGVGTTGTSTITVQAVAALSPIVAGTAIAFKYRAITTGDTHGDLTTGATTGFTTTAGSSQLYLIEVDCQKLASLGLRYLWLKAVEVVDSEVTGGILAILSEPRYSTDHDTVIA